MSRRALALVLAIGVAGILPAVTATPASAGQLDPAFGTGGVVRYEPARPTVDVANAISSVSGQGEYVAGTVGDRMAIARVPRYESDYDTRTTADFGVPSAGYAMVAGYGRFVVAGTAGGDFALADFDSSLNPYRDDGTSGLRRTSFGAAAVARGVTYTDKGVVAAGGVASGQGGSVALARYVGATGALDPTFGSAGKVVDDVSPGADVAHAVLREGIVAGRAGPAALLARYTSDGTPDPTFGTGGHVIFDPTPLDDVAYAVVTDYSSYPRPYGYLVAGAAGTSAFVARFLGDGTPDHAFGNNGVLFTNLGGLLARFTGIVYSGTWNATQFWLTGVVTGVGGDDVAVARMTGAGQLDGGYGLGGVTVTDLGGSADVATGIVGQGVVHVAGGDGADMMVARYRLDGSLDVTTRLGFGTPAIDSFAGSVRTGDGRTLIAGTRRPGGPFLARFLSDGTPDPTFGTGGLIDPGLGGGADARTMSATPDGRILLEVAMDGEAWVARFLPDGHLDPSFGIGGLRKLGRWPAYPAAAMVVLPDGKVLVPLSQGVLARLTASGDLDPTFGMSGITSTPYGGPILLEPDGAVLAISGDASYCHGVRATRIAVDGTYSHAWCGTPGLWPTSVARAADGKIVVAGTTAKPDAYPFVISGDTLVARYLPSGSPDWAFGRVGFVRLDTARDEREVKVAAAPNGTIVFAGRTRNTSYETVPALGRLLPDGRADRSFATGGVARLPFDAWLDDIAVLPDGKVFLTGQVTGDGGGDVALVRYSPGGTALVGLRAWGWNATGTLGNATKVDSRVPSSTAGLVNARSVAAGWYHSAAVLDDGSVWTWGWAGLGQLGTISGADSTTPVHVDEVPSSIAVAAGPYHTLALAIDGTVWAWGWNGTGQLGDGTTTPRSHPTRVPIDRVIGIAAGAGHSLAVREDGTVWAWGWNATGQLGDGTATDRAVPTPVYQMNGAVEVAAGGLHSLAVRNDGTVWSWGWNGVGQLGAGQTGDAWIPYQVPDLDGVARVAAGMHHSLALKTDGTVWSWGWNPLGQMGDGTTTTRFAPVAVPGLTGVARIAGGIYHSLALMPDGTVRAWGWNGVGQLGDGTLTDRWAPVLSTRIDGATTVAGAAHTMAG